MGQVMAFTRPIAGVGVSAEDFGQPVYDRLVGAVRNVGVWRRVANQPLPTNVQTAVSWDTELEDSSGFLTPPNTTIVVPAGMGGLYLVSTAIWCATDIAGVNIIFNQFPETYSARVSPQTGWGGVTAMVVLNAGATFQASAFQGSGATVQMTGRLTVARLVSN